MIEVRILLVVLQIDPVPLQVGISKTEQVLCTGRLPLARLITVTFGLISSYFFLKFLYQGMVGLDTAGKVPSGRDPTTNLMKKNRYKILKTREALYSLLAGLLPTFMPVLLTAMGIDFVDCLL